MALPGSPFLGATSPGLTAGHAVDPKLGGGGVTRERIDACWAYLARTVSDSCCLVAWPVKKSYAA
ncbi:Uncharacterised protein [Mycobacteroides abscessus subsp. abscessus]|nr:Uncharacterised protein [Mycobacteroides abscessus subsp. abscessus]